MDKLRQLGPQLVPPHVKSLSGEADLFELRPRQGRSPCRPIFIRREDDYVILAVSKDHDVDMDATITSARSRAPRYA